jgi:GAF domain-containing protein
MPDPVLMAQTMVTLADTLVDDFDVVDLLSFLSERCVEVLDVTAAGLMLGSTSGGLRVMASSSEGPCINCYRSGAPVVNADAATMSERWPKFAPKALAAGFRSVHALPMRLRGQTIGALNLFHASEGALDAQDVMAAQAFADVATIAILQDRAAREAQTINEQLTHALNSRIVIEQAKGIVAQATRVDMGEAFALLRGHARNQNLKLADVSRGVIDGAIPVASLRAGPKKLP